MRVNVSMDLTVEQAFKILLDILHVKMDDNPPKFKIYNGEIVCDDDDRGELYLALYHLATKIFPNTEFRHLFDNPNTLMNKLYMEKENEDIISEDITKAGSQIEMLVDGTWIKGTVVEGYRYQDGIVTIETADGHRYWCGQDRTDIYRRNN